MQAPSLQVGQLNQSSALGTLPGGPQGAAQNAFMTTQYKTGRYKQNKHAKDNSALAGGSI